VERYSHRVDYIITTSKTTYRCPKILFQQPGPFFVTSKRSNRESENRDHFFNLHASVMPSFYTTLRKEKKRAYSHKEIPMSQEIGYARVSKTEQHLALQIDALKKRGVVRVFTDKQTGVRFPPQGISCSHGVSQ
jgi:Resolvase, N terminal domain